MPYNALIKGRASEANAAYLITAVTAGRKPLFENFATASLVIRELRALERRDECELFAWVLMPDHLHVLLALRRTPLPTLMRMLKGRTARKINAMRGGHAVVWQRGYHDHALRAEEDLVDVARYVVANPLRAKIVGRLGHYPFWDAKWI